MIQENNITDQPHEGRQVILHESRRMKALPPVTTVYYEEDGDTVSGGRFYKAGSRNRMNKNF